MTQIKPYDWLDWNSGHIAEERALRLAVACSAVLPSDKKLQELIGRQIVGDIVELAFHGRRTMERRGMKNAPLGFDPLWPPSTKEVPTGLNLWDAFGIIIHATEITVGWEKPDLSTNPYKGRSPQFAGYVDAKSDTKQVTFSIGTIVTSFFGNVLNKSM